MHQRTVRAPVRSHPEAAECHYQSLHKCTEKRQRTVAESLC